MADEGSEDDQHEDREEIAQVVEEDGDILLNQDHHDRRPVHAAEEVIPPIAPPLPDEFPLGEEWDNVVPSDLADHPVITAFQASNANFLISNPRIAGNPIIYASEVTTVASFPHASAKMQKRHAHQLFMVLHDFCLHTGIFGNDGVSSSTSIG
jgi:hypothetical protein